MEKAEICTQQRVLCRTLPDRFLVSSGYQADFWTSLSASPTDKLTTILLSERREAIIRIMGTQSDEKPMGDSEILVKQSLKYKEIIQEYWTLASQRSLTQQQAERIEEILHKAQSDPWLDFLIDEADHILAHGLGLINEQVIQHQIHELKKSIDRFWCEQILQEIQKQNRSKEIQKYLQDKGLYEGPIDGYMGPLTQTALERLKQEFQSNGERADCLISKCGQSAR